MNAITLGEAKDSSEIENIVTTYDDMTYSITGLQGGLREIKSDPENGIPSLSSNLMVLNNFTQQWEKLSEIPFE